MTSDVIDSAVYDELKEAAGAEFVVELVTAFLEEAPIMFDELRTALDMRDADGFRRAAHSIKSNAEVFGAHALVTPARALELMEVSDVTPEVQASVTELEAEFTRAADALKELQHV
ncbi:Hpt domain-containing protein [Sulfitobacter sp.]|uniref:Hpt domain-containing protein n=1 Tax=Sulfitobacter sp. TaxID=1903071 RepID=UPI0030028555